VGGMTPGGRVTEEHIKEKTFKKFESNMFSMRCYINISKPLNLCNYKLRQFDETSDT